jgi:transposase-like protein
MESTLTETVTELNFVGKVGSLQMANGRRWRYPEIFRRMAVERFKCCENIEWLAKELGVPRQTLYRWHDELERSQDGEEPPTERSRESRLRREINDLKRLVAEKTLEVDFFKGALQRIKARRRESSGSGELASTTTSVT